MELIKTAFQNLLRRRGRTMLTVSGIAVGMLMVSLVSVIGNAGEALAKSELNRMGVGGISVTTDDGRLLNEEALKEIRALPQVASAMPLMIYYGNVVTAKNNQNAVLCGIDAGAGQVISLEVMHGRMLLHSDVESAAAVCVLDEATANAAYGRDNVVGKTVTVQVGNLSEKLTVIGVTKTGSSLLQNMAAMIPGMIYIPYTTQQNLTGQMGFDQFAIRSTTDSETELTQKAIKRVLNRIYQGSAAFRTDDLAAQKDRLLRLVEIVALVLTVLSAVSLVVSGFGIVTALLSAVNERKREIGLKKAIGASQKRILLEFLTEAGLISAVGAVVGMVPAVVLATALPFSGLPIAVSPWLFLRLLGFSVAVGMVFGVYPAYKASRMQPVEALRGE